MIASADRFLRFWTPVIIWMAFIFTLSSIPGRHFKHIHIFGADKIVHLVEFLILGLLLIRAFLNTSSLDTARAIIICVVLATIYAVSDEWHQSFVKDRTADIFDFITDFIGLNAGILMYRKKGSFDDAGDKTL